MNYIKAKFLKGDKPSDRAYTYRCEEELKAGDMVTDAKGSKLVVVDEPVDMAWVEIYGADKVAIVKKHVEPETGLKIGDKVIMNEKYHVSEKNKGKVFTVRSEPQEVGGTMCVWPEGYSGCYAADGWINMRKVPMKQNPCRYCALSWEHKGRHSPSYEKQCGECENLKMHREYLRSQRKFERGEQIESFDELGQQQWVFVGSAERARHIEVIKSWQLRIVLNILAEGKFYKAIRKNIEPVDAGECEE